MRSVHLFVDRAGPDLAILSRLESHCEANSQGFVWIYQGLPPFIHHPSRSDPGSKDQQISIEGILTERKDLGSRRRGSVKESNEISPGKEGDLTYGREESGTVDLCFSHWASLLRGVMQSGGRAVSFAQFCTTHALTVVAEYELGSRCNPAG